MSAPAIEAVGLTKQFGDVVALDGVSLAVDAGTVLGLLGPNGAGKTTAVNILTTILPADGGTATILGLDVGARAHQVRTRIGLAGQYAAVDERLTGRENLYMVARLNHLAKTDSRRRAGELLDRFSLSDAADRPVRTYSGGMRRRLDLAASLVNSPPVLFLDEPTTGLDPRSRKDLWEVIEGLVSEGTTLLLTTQYLEEADRLADRIMLIDHGKVIEEGTSTELKGRSGSTLIEIRFDRADHADRARGSLEGIGSTEVGDGGLVVSLGVTDGTRALMEVVRRLDAAGLIPDDIDVREPTLDDVFLQLTGHKAAPEAAKDDLDSAAASAS